MDWRVKAALLRMLNSIPGAQQWRYFAQNYVTNSLPREVAPIRANTIRLGSPINHIKAFRSYSDLDLSQAFYFEFGGGWDLYYNLVYYSYGINSQLVVDIDALLRPELVDHVIRRLDINMLEGALRCPERGLGADPIEDLEELYGIKYRAPVDILEVDLEQRAVDLMSTTSTLEHIPETSLRNIVEYCCSICHARSVVSMFIDYSDHYSHTDTSVTPYNFLRFNSEEWERYNSEMLYQNRLRHSDYRRIFERAGFQIIRERMTIPEGGSELLSEVPVNREFSKYEEQELIPTHGLFVMRPASSQV